MRISIRKVLLACVVLSGMGYGITVLRGSHGLGSFDEKRRQIERLEQENESLHREIAAKQNYLSNLQQNPDELKLEIERRLKLVPKGSKQFILQDGTRVDVPAAARP